MEENCRFQVETTYDLANCKEFTAGAVYTSRVRQVLRLLSTISLVFILSQFPRLWDVGFYSKWLLILCGSFLAIEGIQRFVNRNGDINYKRHLMTNGGVPPINMMRFEEHAVVCHNAATGNTVTYSYDQVKWMFETKHLLVAVMQLRLCLIMDKRNINGGTVEEFKEYLLAKCLNVKRKKIRSCTFGKWLYRIQIAITILCMLFALANLPGIALFDRLSGKLTNSLSYQEIADELAGIGIQITDQAIEEVETYDEEYIKENGAAYYEDYPTASKVLDLICWEAAGFYDEETWEWTPSTSGLYWFDTEVWNAGAIYTDFFTGLSSMNEELAFTNVTEDFSQADVEAGTGTILVSFDYDGAHHQLEAEYYFDWFDVNFLKEIGQLLSEDDSASELYYYYDGQAILLYYGTSAQLRDLEQKTGIDFSGIMLISF